MTDLVAEIWESAVPGDFPTTAEGRAEVDRVLRTHLKAIEDDTLRHHAAQLIRERRAAAMHSLDPSGLRGIIRHEVEAVLREKGLIE